MVSEEKTGHNIVNKDHNLSDIKVVQNTNLWRNIHIKLDQSTFLFNYYIHLEEKRID